MNMTRATYERLVARIGFERDLALTLLSDADANGLPYSEDGRNEIRYANLTLVRCRRRSDRLHFANVIES